MNMTLGVEAGAQEQYWSEGNSQDGSPERYDVYRSKRTLLASVRTLTAQRHRLLTPAGPYKKLILEYTR